MSNIKNEVITKLRNDIRDQLDQIGAFVDNELADYIMVLVANQKTKYQMKDDLSLFLGAATDEFVNWLHTSLKQIQTTAGQTEDKKVVTSDKKETKEMTKKSSFIATKSKSKHKKMKTDDKNETTVKSERKSVDINKDIPKVGAVSPQPKDSLEATEKKTVAKISDNSDIKEQNDGEVVLRLNPDGEDIDELLQENIVEEKKKNQVKTVKKVTPLKREDITVETKKHKKQEKEDDEEDRYDPNRPVLASVVRISERKSSVPLEMYANKQLLLKAVKDANDSTQGKRKRTADDLAYTPTPIKRRLGDRQEPDIGEDLDPNDLRNYLKVNKKEMHSKSDAEETPKSRTVRKPIAYIEDESLLETSDPQFVVTLNGIDHNKYLQNIEFEDRIVFDEEMDEELLVEPESGTEFDNMENEDLVVNKVNERCRFWPQCKNGDECEFLHPNTPCKTFPNCRFGDKCLYIHPNCKFDAKCSRRDCPFTHASRRKIPTSAAIISSLLPPSSVKQCKYLPNCKNPACPYYHPKFCRFGDKCRHLSCPFFHPYTHYAVAATVPHPNQLKWKAKDHISERQFAKESNTTTASTTS